MPEGGNLTLETANAILDDDYAATNIDARPGEYVVISVADSGTGMTPEVMARAFDPFFTTKETGKGTGLGLSQVYGFVRQSEGHVSVESRVGAGTTVRIHLPRYQGALEPSPAAAQDAPAARSNRELVLVVEDEADVRGMTVEALRSLGYSVIAARRPRTRPGPRGRRHPRGPAVHRPRHARNERAYARRTRRGNASRASRCCSPPGMPTAMHSRMAVSSARPSSFASPSPSTNWRPKCAAVWTSLPPATGRPLRADLRGLSPRWRRRLNCLNNSTTGG